MDAETREQLERMKTLQTGACPLQPQPETLLQQLIRVQRAIAIIESGAQEYQIGNRRLTKADLKTLYDREAALKQAISAEENGDSTGLMIRFAATGID